MIFIAPLGCHWEHFFIEARALVVPGEQGMTPQADLTPGRFWQSIIAHFRDRLQSCFDRRYRRANCSNHWENIGDWCEASRTTLSEPCISIWQVWGCMFLRIRLESILELCLKGFKTPILISTDEERLVTYFHPEKTKLSHVKMLKLLPEDWSSHHILVQRCCSWLPAWTLRFALPKVLPLLSWDGYVLQGPPLSAWQTT